MDTEELPTIFINKIPQITPMQQFIFKSQWGLNEIELQILDTHHSKEWDVIIPYDELKKSAEELEIPYENFYQECKEALTRNGGVEHFQYLVVDDKFILIKCDQFQIQYLEVCMKPNYDLQNSITLTAADLIASLRVQLSAAEQESKNINDKYQTMLKTLEKYLEEKNLIERKMMRKFAVLLNSKKDKIAELQDLLVEKSQKLDNVEISDAESNKRRSGEMLGISIDSGDDFMQATQMMTQPVVTLPKRRKFNAADEVAPRRTSFSTDIVGLDLTTGEGEGADGANSEIQESSDIFQEI